MRHTLTIPPLGSAERDSSPVFNVVIAYEDFETGKQAKKTYDFLAQNLGSDCHFTNQMWKFDVLGILGSIQDGLSRSEYVYPLAIKAIIDGLATLGFVSLFGWGVLLASLPVLAFQGTITLMCSHFFEPLLAAHSLVNSVNAVGGLLVFCVALVMLGLKRIELADYLPSLVFAPLLTWFWR